MNRTRVFHYIEAGTVWSSESVGLRIRGHAQLVIRHTGSGFWFLNTARLPDLWPRHTASPADGGEGAALSLEGL